MVANLSKGLVFWKLSFGFFPVEDDWTAAFGLKLERGGIASLING